MAILDCIYYNYKHVCTFIAYNEFKSDHNEHRERERDKRNQIIRERERIYIVGEGEKGERE